MDTKNPLSDLLNPAIPFIRIWVFSLFTRWVGQGYFSPENATVLQNWVMDGVAFAPIALWSLWAYYKAWRARQLEAIVKAATNLPKEKQAVVVEKLAEGLSHPPAE